LAAELHTQSRVEKPEGTMPRFILTLALSAGIFVAGALVADKKPLMPDPAISGTIRVNSNPA
jgi:hypothetical protein